MKVWITTGILIGVPRFSDKFEGFFRHLPERGDSERSWTIDITARRQEAKRQADPLREKAQPLTATAIQLRAQIKELKKQNTPDARVVTGDIDRG